MVKQIIKGSLALGLFFAAVYFAPEFIKGLVTQFLYGIGVGLGILVVLLSGIAVLAKKALDVVDEFLSALDESIDKKMNAMEKTIKEIEKFELVDEYGHPIVKSQRRSLKVTKKEIIRDPNGPPVKDHKFQSAFNGEWCVKQNESVEQNGKREEKTAKELLVELMEKIKKEKEQEEKRKREKD